MRVLPLLSPAALFGLALAMLIAEIARHDRSVDAQDCSFVCIQNPGCNKTDTSCGGCTSCTDNYEGACAGCVPSTEYDYNPNSENILRADPGGNATVTFDGKVTCYKTRSCGGIVVWGPYYECGFGVGSCRATGTSSQYCRNCASLGSWGELRHR